MARRRKSIADVTAQIARIRNAGIDLLHRNVYNYRSGSIGYDDYNKSVRNIEERVKKAMRVGNTYRDNILNKTASPVQRVSYSARAGISG